MVDTRPECVCVCMCATHLSSAVANMCGDVVCEVPEHCAWTAGVFVHVHMPMILAELHMAFSVVGEYLAIG